MPSIHDAAHLLGINRTSVYYAHKVYEPSEDELACKRIIDHVHTDNPAWGARQLATQLQRAGYLVGRRKTARYMREMGIDAIYPRMNLSKRQQHAQVMPYLLKNVVITRPNQAWSVDITYIPIKHGFLYLTAVIDWYSRCIVGWEIDDPWILVWLWRHLIRLSRQLSQILSIQIRVVSSPAGNINHSSVKNISAKAWMAKAAGPIMS